MLCLLLGRSGFLKYIDKASTPSSSESCDDSWSRLVFVCVHNMLQNGSKAIITALQSSPGSEWIGEWGMRGVKRWKMKLPTRARISLFPKSSQYGIVHVKNIIFSKTS